ncbi:MAG: AMP-binding protein, partial [bacterium]|nr:AMP-binding protein [bacterium]
QEIIDPMTPIGKPVSNTACFILDHAFNPVPIGVTGEICLSGIHLAAGYLNKPGLTADTFIEWEQHKIYQTGDLARWQSDGDIVFLGRKDGQVKIRGFRVEPLEIETHLLSHPAIKEAAVFIREETDGDKILHSCVVTADETKLPAEKELRDHLSRFLPDYMIPSSFTTMETFPLTPSGKTDREALSQLPIPGSQLQTSYTPPRNRVESGLVRIWRDILNRDRIGIHDNFFHLGGHSLKATQVVSRACRDMSLEIGLQDLFTTPTIAGLAAVAEKNSSLDAPVTFTVIPPVEEREYYNTSHAQKRLWVIHRMEENFTAYNIPMAVEITGQVDIHAFIKALETIVKRHEPLRTTFIAIDGDPKQKIHGFGSIGFKVDYRDLRGNSKGEEIASQKAVEDVTTPFDLEKGPLVRAQLFHIDESRFVFLLNMHHIIADGWSLQVFRYEIFTLYDAFVKGQENPLLPLKVRYNDFTEWQNNHIRSEDENYWLEKLSGELSLVHFIYDFPKGDFNTFEGGMERITVSPEVTRRLNDLAQRNRVTLSTVLLAIFTIFLGRLTGQTDILVASSIANRVNPDVEKMIGFFVNMMIIRTDLSRFGQLSFEEFLTGVHHTQLEAFEHQGYPFDLLVEKINPRRYTNYQPLFNVGFAFQNFTDVSIQLDLRNPDDTFSPDFQPFETRS